jgi:predicted CXXCH cytochrome family protein
MQGGTIMNRLFLSQFMERFNAEKRLKPVAISWIVGVVIAGAAQMAGAAFTISPATLQSTGPCLFAEQLQKSASIRNQYTAKLVAALGGRVSASNSFEKMDGNKTPAPYREGESGQTEPTVNFWGFEIKQAISTTGIDWFSADCLGCHDGAVALSVRTVYKNNPLGRSRLLGSDQQMIGMDHPIGMDYNRYAAASKDYKPLFGISNKMVFVNGKVGCLTCHDPLNPEKGHLVMSDRGSALCLTCHNN